MRWRASLALLAAVLASLGVPAVASADPCPNAEVRTGASARLAECRAYEAVSPADKGGLGVFVAGGAASALGMTRPSIDGDAVVFSSWGVFGGATMGTPSSYRAARTGEGWTTEVVSPPPADPDPDAATDRGIPVWDAATPDLEVGVLSTTDFPDPTDVNDVGDVYLRRPGATELVGRGNGSERAATGTSYGGISADGSQVLFSTADHLVPGDAARVAGRELYARMDGQTRLVNQVDGGGALITQCGSQVGPETVRNALSADGRRIVFTVPSIYSAGDPACGLPREVYMRVDHQQTIHVSASQRIPVDPDGAAPKQYEGASVDGNKVFFSSSERLTDDAAIGGGVYRYTVSTGLLELLTGWGVSVSKVSADGSRLYYVSVQAYTPDAVPGNRNLYVYDRGTTKLVASDPDFTADGLDGTAGGEEHVRRAAVSHDGRYLVFSTKSVLTSFDHAGRRAVYRYDVVADDLVCVSCDPAAQRPRGSAPVGNAGLSSFIRFRSTTPFYGDDYGANVSSDGRVVFDAADRLVAGDTNAKSDVYMYDGQRLSLISSGRGGDDSVLVGMAADGRDVFFATSDSLVASDLDGGNADIYTARIGGGFEQAAPDPRATCDGDGCQSPPAPGPPSTIPGSSVFSAPWSNVGRRAATARLSVSGARVVRGASATVRVRVPRKGRIRASGAGLRVSSKAVGRAGTYRMGVRLAKRSRRALEQGRSVRVRVRVLFAASGGDAPRTTSLVVTFKPEDGARSATASSISKGSR